MGRGPWGERRASGDGVRPSEEVMRRAGGADGLLNSCSTTVDAGARGSVLSIYLRSGTRRTRGRAVHGTQYVPAQG